MIYLKKIMQITLLLLFAFSLNIIAWIPSVLVENIVNFTILILIIISVFLAYQTIHIAYMKQKKKYIWKNVLYTALLMSYIGVFAIMMIGASYSKSKYVESYTFGDTFFYVYENVDSSFEVSFKDSKLPIRSLPIASFPYTPIKLQKENQYIHATGVGIDEKIYDLEKNVFIKDLKNKKEVID